MNIELNFHDLITIKLIDPIESVASFFKREFSLFVERGQQVVGANIIVSFSSNIKIPANALKLLPDFYYSAYERSFFLLFDKKILKYTYHISDSPRVEVLASPDFPVWLLYYSVERSLFPLMAKRGYAMIHAGAVEVEGEGYLISALQGGGKTLSILNHLKNGAGFLGDDLVFVDAKGVCLSHQRLVNFNQYHGIYFEKAKSIYLNKMSFLKRFVWYFKTALKKLCFPHLNKLVVRLNCGDVFDNLKNLKKIKIETILIKFDSNPASVDDNWPTPRQCTQFLSENMKYEISSHIAQYLSALKSYSDSYTIDLRDEFSNIESIRTEILNNFSNNIKVKNHLND